VAFKKTKPSFSDIAVSHRLKSINSFLLQIDKIIDVEKLRPTLNKNGIGTKNVCGQKAYDNVMMFKILLLQKYYNLSDKAVEESLYTNLLFIKFTGLSLDESVPDDTTICRFRNSLIENNLYNELFDSINEQLAQKGLKAKEGKAVLIDASLIKSGNNKISSKDKKTQEKDKIKVKEQNKEIELKIEEELKKEKPSIKKINRLLKKKEFASKSLKNKAIDEKQNIDSKAIETSISIIANNEDSYNHHSKTDKEVRTGYHTSKKAYTQGYKIHIAQDKETGIILKSMTTFANTSDISTIEPFIKSINNVSSIYADKAYKSKDIDEYLKQKKITNNICLKEKQNMTEEEKHLLRKDELPKHKIRAIVEHRFANIKHYLKYNTTRYIGLVRNNLNFTLVCIAANLKLMAHKMMKLQKS
jgi:IS5 family transposase